MGAAPTERPATCEDQQSPPPSEMSSYCSNDGDASANSEGNGLVSIALLSGDNSGLLGSLLNGTTVDLGSLLGGSPTSADATDVADLGLSLTLASTLDSEPSICEPSTSLLDIGATDVLVDASLDIS